MVRSRQKGFTLIELAITVTIASILVCMTTSLMLATVKFGKLLSDRVEATREARIVVSDMTNILRFSTGNLTCINDSANQSVAVSIEDHHLGGVPANSGVIYRRTKSNNNLRRIFYNLTDNITRSDILLSQNVQFFNTTGAWNNVSGELALELQFTVNGTTVPVKTKVKLLGDR
ncbi:MAG: prepilin-type N-terminal cleavage/methylation domain-containing protein [Candidatus Omnitrophica bacterium]|nr:prepilin-type N-terminal cleavage/methylation domain-containing protein [Candidatus Omnitrophota bacterium]